MPRPNPRRTNQCTLKPEEPLYPGMKIDSWLWKAYAESGLYPADKPVRDFTDEQKHALYYLSDVKTKIIGINMSYQGLIVRLQSSVLSKDKDSLQKHMKGSAATSLTARSSKRKYALPPELSKPATPDATTCAASTSTSRSACSVPSPALQARASLRCWRVCRRTSQSACSSWTKPPSRARAALTRRRIRERWMPSVRPSPKPIPPRIIR